MLEEELKTSPGDKDFEAAIKVLLAFYFVVEFDS